MDEKQIEKKRPPTDTEKQLMFVQWLAYTGWSISLEGLAAVIHREHGGNDFNLSFIPKHLPDVKITIEHKKKFIKV